MQKIKSPIIYMGGKYDMLEYIEALLPKKFFCFYDVFGGAFNVGCNMPCELIVYNDIEYRIKEFFELMKNTEPHRLDEMIRNRIVEVGLIRYKHDTYYKFRDMYNQNQNPLDMFILCCYSYMHMLQWNKEGKMNCACGDAEYNQFIRGNLLAFGMKMRRKNIEFYSTDFHEIINKALDEPTIGGDVVYCDPPYLITNGAYNHRKYQWCSEDEDALYKILNVYADAGGLFILSNVFDHRNQSNEILKKFAERYYVYHVPNKNYRNLDNLMKPNVSAYETETDEVLVTNIKEPRNPKIFQKGKARSLW